MEKPDRIEETVMQQKTNDGKDEMNLAEFPLCALSRRLKPDQKTLRFEDRIEDKGRNEWIIRQLIITGSDAFGLPTALDDEILLGLIQLTRQRNFAERKIPFTRHELLRLLDWRDDSKNYLRLETSLNRWTGVTLYYKKAWWNKARKCWVDEKFHVLDNVWLCHRGEEPPDTGLAEPGVPISAFVWNETIFRSFQAGNLKSIDFEFYKSLDSAVAKRLYRFLDKRFYHRHRCEFKLRELACQHVGLAQGYDTANLKRKLLPGILELERRGYLSVIAETDRFRKQRAGEWLIQFKKGRSVKASGQSDDGSGVAESSLAQMLIDRGVSSEVATNLCARHPEADIRSKLNAFDWLVQRKDGRISENPPGFLVSSIKTPYGQPKGFMASPEKVQTPEINKKAKARKRVRIKAEVETVGATRQNAIEAFWRSLPEPERAKVEAEVIATASTFQRGVIERGGPFSQTARKSLLDAYVLKRLPPPVE